jgi:hypothetical protein
MFSLLPPLPEMDIEFSFRNVAILYLKRCTKSIIKILHTVNAPSPETFKLLLLAAKREWKEEHGRPRHEREVDIARGL